MCRSCRSNVTHGSSSFQQIFFFGICPRCCMLRVCLTALYVMHEALYVILTLYVKHEALYVTTPTRSFIRYTTFNQTGPPRWVDCSASLREFIPRTQQYIAQFRNRTDNLAIANLRCYPPSCTAVSWDDSI